jgi:hypothetical protein
LLTPAVNFVTAENNVPAPQALGHKQLLYVFWLLNRAPDAPKKDKLNRRKPVLKYTLDGNTMTLLPNS